MLGPWNQGGSWTRGGSSILFGSETGTAPPTLCSWTRPALATLAAMRIFGRTGRGTTIILDVDATDTVDKVCRHDLLRARTFAIDEQMSRRRPLRSSFSTLAAPLPPLAQASAPLLGDHETTREATSTTCAPTIFCML